MPYQSLLPIFTWFVIGIALRRREIADAEHAAFLFRFVFFVTLPALAFSTISASALTSDAWLLPVAGFVVNLCCMLVALLYARRAGMSRAQAGTVVLGSCIVNMVFMFPFVLGLLGEAGLSQAVLYDVGNAAFVATVAYLAALRFGAGDAPPMTQFLIRTLRAPLFIAIAAALVVNVAAIAVPDIIMRIVEPIGAATSPLILVALGISFSLARIRDAVALHTAALRMLTGLIAGILITLAFGFTGLTAVVVIAGAAAPIGFNAVTLSSIGRLETEQATAALSVSVAIGLLSAPLLLVAAAPWLGA